jgi:cobalt/nickel transport system permease protein
MKKLILIVAAIMLALAILLPFASKTPDGIQALTATSGNQQQPVWNGLMANYSVALANPYVSRLIAGLFGTGIVLAASFGLGTTLAQKKKAEEKV